MPAQQASDFEPIGRLPEPQCLKLLKQGLPLLDQPEASLLRAFQSPKQHRRVVFVDSLSVPGGVCLPVETHGVFAIERCRPRGIEEQPFTQLVNVF